jgi:hypothetical protein
MIILQQCNLGEEESIRVVPWEKDFGDNIFDSFLLESELLTLDYGRVYEIKS